MTGDRQQSPDARAITSRRRVLAAAAFAPVLTVASPATAHTLPAGMTGAGHGMQIKPAPTALEDWAGVAKALGRGGNMLRGTTYHTGFPGGISWWSPTASSSPRGWRWARTWPSSATPTAPRWSWATWWSPSASSST